MAFTWQNCSVYSSSRGTCIPCSYNTTFNVSGCSKYRYDMPNSCAICEKGYDNKNNKCILRLDVIERPSLEIVQSEINFDFTMEIMIWY